MLLLNMTCRRPEQILESNADADAWKLEVERVAPQLKGGCDAFDKIYFSVKLFLFFYLSIYSTVMYTNLT